MALDGILPVRVQACRRYQHRTRPSGALSGGALTWWRRSSTMKRICGVGRANGVFLAWIATAAWATSPHEASAQERKGFWIGGGPLLSAGDVAIGETRGGTGIDVDGFIDL